MLQKPSIPKGTRDFSPEEMSRRNFIFETVTRVFKQHGFLPIETPAMENLSSLLGKYGEEGDRLIFRILNSGDFLSEVDPVQLPGMEPGQLALKICGKGLRYDLTVPFARYVVMHREEITFPFKRYQVQPVWRADKPQKGRYREFFQCDVDVIGSDSLLNETELICIIDEVFTALGIRVLIRINNRKILSGIAETIGMAEKFTGITTAIDKLDKIGLGRVVEELLSKGISQDAVERLTPFLQVEGSNQEKISYLRDLFPETGSGKAGLQEVEEVLFYTERQQHQSPVTLDFRLARGLNYYTGTIIEVSATEVAMGSICGGGRYDDLTGIFGLPGISGVGVSFGADRIYDVMSELNLFPPAASSSTQVMLVNFGREEAVWCMTLAAQLRNAGVAAELFPEPAKLKKQLNYADKKGIPYVILVGENEMRSGIITVREMQTGNQFEGSLEELIRRIER